MQGTLSDQIKLFINNSNEDERTLGFFSSDRIDEFISIIEKDYNGFTENEFNKKFSLDILYSLRLTLEERLYINKLIPIVIKKISETNKLTGQSDKDKNSLLSEIKKLPELLGQGFHNNQTESVINYFYWHGKASNKYGYPTNQTLSGIILPVDKTDEVKIPYLKNDDDSPVYDKDISKDLFTIDFEKIRNEKNPESINLALNKLFSNYNYSESYLYLITGFITLVQSQEYGLKSETIKLGLEKFLKDKFPIFLEDPEELNKNNNKILTNPDFWRIRNLLQLYELGSRVENEKGKDKLIVGTFSPGGSYGPIYLGQLYNQFQEEKASGKNILPDLYIGSSAGALYPTLFLLWKMALEKNPEGLKKIIPDGIEIDNLNSLLSLIPENINSSDSMFMNGEKLINNFFDEFKKLVQIISPDKKTDFDNLSFKDLDLPLISVSSFEYEKDKFVPGLFTNNDNIRKSIITSSNPMTTILGFDVNVLSSDNEVYGRKWHDGYHSLNNPIEMGYLLNHSKINRYESFYTGEKDVIRYSGSDNEVGEYKPLDGIKLDNFTQSDSFDKDNAIFYSIIGKVGKLEIYNLYDLLIEIKNSPLKEKKKKFFRDKLVNFFLSKDPKDFIFGKNPEILKSHSLKLTKLIEEKLLSDKETQVYLNTLFLYDKDIKNSYSAILSTTKKSIELRGKIFEKLDEIKNQESNGNYSNNDLKEKINLHINNEMNPSIKKSYELIKVLYNYYNFFYNQLKGIIITYKDSETVKSYLLNLKEIFIKTLELNLFPEEDMKKLKDVIIDIDELLKIN